MTSGQAKTIHIFYCYAHQDDLLRDNLDRHLEPLKHLGIIDTCCDHEVQAGSEWRYEVDRRFNNADVLLLLVSPNFIRSEYCYHVEMLRALERHHLGSVHVIPIILRPVLWQITPIGRLQVLPINGKPIVKWRNCDDAFCDVVQGIYKVVEALRKQDLQK